MSEYISKEELKDYLEKNISFGGTEKKFRFYDIIDSLPPADVRPNIHGHWEDEEDIFARCSKCGLRIFLCQRWFKCCPRCMAVMDEEPKGEKGET